MRTDNIFIKLLKALYSVILYLFLKTFIVVAIQSLIVWAASTNTVAFGYDWSQIVTQQQLIDLLNNFSVHITIVVSLVIIPIFSIMIRNDRKINKDKSFLKFPDIKGIIKIILLAVSANIVLNNIISVSNLAAYSTKFQTTQESLYSAGIGIELLGSALIIPIAEELVFRGVLYGRLKGCFGTLIATVFSSLIFGILHGNLVQFVYATLLGIIFVFIYEKYRTLTAPIIAHIAANAFSIFLTETKILTQAYANNTILFIITVVCAIIMAFILGSLVYKK